MYAFYNKSTNKFMHLYTWLYYGEDLQYSLDDDEDELVYTSLDRSVLERILNGDAFGSGDNLQDPQVNPGLLDGFEIVKLGVL